ncbi:MAG: putative lyase [Pedosphaera sp.]|nr:putative lyase [Pedosphaera sp.]
MRKRGVILLAMLIVAVVGGIGWLVLRPREPVYEGKTLSEWLDGDVRSPSPSSWMIAAKQSKNAVVQMGTNAIPWLLLRLRAKDSSPLMDKLVALAQKLHLYKVKARLPARIRRAQGENGFLALGAEGKSAVPELIVMYEQKSLRECRESVANALGSIGPAAKAAVPAIVRGLSDMDEVDSNYAAKALGRIHAEPELAVPALVNCLNHHYFLLRQNAARALTRFGAEAKPAVPTFVKLLSDPDQEVKQMAKDALAKIDPEALAWAGVK